MSINTEIEFKTMLSKNEYNELLQTLTYQQEIQQENFYFDTPNQLLKQNRMGLRVRIFPHNAELTLKIPKNDNELIEMNHQLTDSEFKKFKKSLSLPYYDKIANYLAEQNINYDDLQLFARLATHRYVNQLTSDATIMLDKSSYYGMIDYELEMEVNDRNRGSKLFFSFLKEYNITYRKADNKIARALHAKINSDF